MNRIHVNLRATGGVKLQLMFLLAMTYCDVSQASICDISDPAFPVHLEMK